MKTHSFRAKSGILLWFFITFVVSNQNIYSQQVGIGTVNPTTMLHVVPQNSLEPLRIESLLPFQVQDTAVLITNPTDGTVRYIYLSDLANIVAGGSTGGNNISLILNGTNLELTDEGGTLIADLSSLVQGTVHNINNISDTTLIINPSNNDFAYVTDCDGNGNSCIYYYNGNSWVPTDNDIDPTNELLTGANISGDTLYITDAGGSTAVDLSNIASNNVTTINNISDTTLIINPSNNEFAYVTDCDGNGNPCIYYYNGNSWVPTDNDIDPTNEYNTQLQLSGNILSVTDGGGTRSVDLSPITNSGTTKSFAFACANNQTVSGSGGQWMTFTTAGSNFNGVQLVGNNKFLLQPNKTYKLEANLNWNPGDPHNFCEVHLSGIWRNQYNSNLGVSAECRSNCSYADNSSQEKAFVIYNTGNSPELVGVWLWVPSNSFGALEQASTGIMITEL